MVYSIRLGCSPSQLVFGHRVRGPIQLLHDRLLGNVSLTEGSRQLMEIQSELKKYKDVASEHLKESQLKIKQYHDKKFRVTSGWFRQCGLVLVKKKTEWRLLLSIILKIHLKSYPDCLSLREFKTLAVHINRLKAFQGSRPVSCALQETDTSVNHLHINESNMYLILNFVVLALLRCWDTWMKRIREKW